MLATHLYYSPRESLVHLSSAISKRSESKPVMVRAFQNKKTIFDSCEKSIYIYIYIQIKIRLLFDAPMSLRAPRIILAIPNTFFSWYPTIFRACKPECFQRYWNHFGLHLSKLSLFFLNILLFFLALRTLFRYSSHLVPLYR